MENSRTFLTVRLLHRSSERATHTHHLSVVTYSSFVSTTPDSADVGLISALTQPGAPFPVTSVSIALISLNGTKLG